MIYNTTIIGTPVLPQGGGVAKAMIHPVQVNSANFFRSFLCNFAARIFNGSCSTAARALGHRSFGLWMRMKDTTIGNLRSEKTVEHATYAGKGVPLN